jgi:hypothetical protein
MSVFHEVDGGGVEHPQNWRVFLTSLLISLILFCIISIFSAAANYFSMRRNLVMGLK